MKVISELKNGWHIKHLDPAEHLNSTDIERFSDKAGDAGSDWIAAVMPAQVHEILLLEGLIEDPALLGAPQKCTWVAEKDWIYRCRFASSDLIVDAASEIGRAHV